MRYKVFGRTGLRVSELCLGAMSFGTEWKWGADAAQARQVFDIFAEAGGNFIDTSCNYTEGTSEKIVGDLIKPRRDEFVVSTKYSLSSPMDPPGSVLTTGNNIKNMRRSVESSLKRLQTDYIDILWLHIWDFMTPVDEILRGLDALVRSGKVNYIAISDTPAWQIARANTMADLMGWHPFVGIQVLYNLIDRRVEADYLPMAKSLDLGITCWQPLQAGILSGLYHSKNRTTARGVSLSDRDVRIAEAVNTLAREVGCTPAQLSLAWLRHQGRKWGTIWPLLAVETIEQIVSNLKVVDITLDDAVAAKLDEISKPEGTANFMEDHRAIFDAMTTNKRQDLIDNHHRLGR